MFRQAVDGECTEDHERSETDLPEDRMMTETTLRLLLLVMALALIASIVKA
jgi:hypothetical protein